MAIINFTEYSSLSLSTDVKSPVILVAHHSLISAYGISYYNFGWQNLQRHHPNLQIELWIDCQDNITLSLQSVYAKVTGIISTLTGPLSKKFNSFCVQQGVIPVANISEIPTHG